ncbi:DJ-1 family glyoxalase III [Arhodomonas sp. AD133]|uniref:DJ-1 family glyoxalase III n=1 Tax=Arhodomonas sp. AD133 TaxID=3415009 RepID=UPI003EB6FF02
MACVLVPLAEGCEELEAVTVIDLLRRAGIEVTVAALADGPVTASRGVVLEADTTLASVLADDFDMIVLPGGGEGAKRLTADERVRDLLARHAESGGWTAAICAAPSVLAGAGLLAGRQVTSFPGWLDEVADITYLEEPVVTDDRVVTSRGPGTAMDFALALIEHLEGTATAAGVEAKLQRPAAHQRYADT